MSKQDKMAKRLAAIYSHPKYFLKYCVFTRDPNDPDNPVKKFPFHLEYHQRATDLWFNNTKYITLKSRQMQESWRLLACNLWLAMTGPHRDIYIRKSIWEEAVELVERMKFMYDHIPEEIWPLELRPKFTIKQGEMSFTEINSNIYAVASGKDKARGKTPTSVIIDEYAFMEDDELSFATLKPALQGSARVALISTPCPIFGKKDPYHRRIIEDRTGDADYQEEAAAINAELAKLPKIEGYKEWINPRNGFACTEIHYTADPKKRTKLWKQRAMAGMDKKTWNTEMELSWEMYTGDAVFGGEFNPNIHIPQETILVNPDYPVLRGWDFGGNHSCVITQYIEQALYVIDSFPNMGYNTRTIAAHIQDECLSRYGEGIVYKDIIDPSGMWEGKTSTGLACGDVMRELGMELIPGIQDPTRRIDAMMKLLISLRNGTARLQVNKHCDMIIRAFQGGYHYPEKETQNQRINRPVKNEYSHIMDALCYVGTKITDTSLFFKPKVLTNVRSTNSYKFS